jgi:O-antigen/teichoic acid export membrane protein
MANLTKSSLLYIGAAALSATVPFIVLPIIARWLGPAEFGIVGSYLAVVNICTVLAGLSVHGIISVVHFRQSPTEVPSYVNGALRVLLLTLGPLISLLILLGPLLELYIGVPAKWLWTAGAVGGFQFIVSLALAVFQTLQQPIRYGVLQVGLALGWGVFSLLLIGVWHFDWSGRAVGQLIAIFITALVALIFLYREGMLTTIDRPAPLRTLMRFGLPLLPHSLAATFMGVVDRLLLVNITNTEMAGQYFAAFQMASVLTVAAAAVNQAWVPWLYDRLSENKLSQRLEVVYTTYAIYALLLAAAALLVISASWLVPLVAGDRYISAIPLLRWLAPAAAFSGMYFFVTNYLFFTSRTELLAVITVFCSAIQLGLMIYFIPRWGAEGAGMAVFITAFIYWLCTWIAANCVVPMPWFSKRERTAS